jgi:hypothetical protein
MPVIRPPAVSRAGVSPSELVEVESHHGATLAARPIQNSSLIRQRQARTFRIGVGGRANASGGLGLLGGRGAGDEGDGSD